MENRGEEIVRELVREARQIRESAFNGLDPALNHWRERVRKVLQEFAPVKVPAFDEIRFASDFFLSKPEGERQTINDRIALACDLDLGVDILGQAVDLLREKRQTSGGGRQTHPAASEATSPGDVQPLAASPEAAGSGRGPGIEDLLRMVESLDLSPREKDEAIEELKRAERALQSQPPDWDRIKRCVKYLLDFDKGLALRAVPALLQRVPASR